MAYTDTQIKEFVDFWLPRGAEGANVIANALQANPDIDMDRLSTATQYTPGQITQFFGGNLPQQLRGRVSDDVRHSRKAGGRLFTGSQVENAKKFIKKNFDTVEGKIAIYQQAQKLGLTSEQTAAFINEALLGETNLTANDIRSFAQRNNLPELTGVAIPQQTAGGGTTTTTGTNVRNLTNLDVPTFQDVFNIFNQQHLEQFGVPLNRSSAADPDVAKAWQDIQTTYKASIDAFNALHGTNLPPPPTWIEIWNEWNNEHIAQFGQPMNRPWNADPDAAAAKDLLDKRYIAALEAYNEQHGTNLTPDPYVLGPTAQITGFVPNKQKKSGIAGSIIGSIAGWALAGFTGGSSLLFSAIGGGLGRGLQTGDWGEALKGALISAATSFATNKLFEVLGQVFPTQAAQGTQALAEAAAAGGYTFSTPEQLAQMVEAGTTGAEGAFIESAALNGGTVMFGPDGVPIGADIGEAFVSFNAASPFFSVSDTGAILSSADGVNFSVDAFQSGTVSSGGGGGTTTTGLTAAQQDAVNKLQQTFGGAAGAGAAGAGAGAAAGAGTGAAVGSAISGALPFLGGLALGSLPSILGGDGAELSPEERALLTEQTEILRLQRSLFQQQVADALKMQPELLKSLGYGRDAQGNLIKLPASAEEQAKAELQLKALGLSNAELENLLAAQPQEQEISQLLRDRELAALRGELPIDPTLRRALDEERQRLEASLRANLGPGFETSTPGFNALTEFSKRRAEAEYTANRNEIILAEQLGTARRAASLESVNLGLNTAQLAESIRKSRLGDVFSVQQLPFGPAANLSSTAAGFSGPLSTLSNSRLAGLQQQGQLASGIGQLAGAALFSPIYGAGKPSLFGTIFS